jgi:TfoX/Sxy family transcriptional regulator of competence genes
MPYYVESEAHALREKFEEIVLGWPGVSKRMMFGSPSYAAGRTIFAMLVTSGVILTRLDDDQKSALLSGGMADYFTGHGRVMKKWIVIAVKDPSSIERYLPYITASYHAALAEGEANP